jgi:hypothetical protein
MLWQRVAIIKELTKQSNRRPARLCNYCAAFIKMIEKLKFQNAQS